jgi:hypothetical protein
MNMLEPVTDWDIRTYRNMVLAEREYVDKTLILEASCNPLGVLTVTGRCYEPLLKDHHYIELSDFVFSPESGEWFCHYKVGGLSGTMGMETVREYFFLEDFVITEVDDIMPEFIRTVLNLAVNDETRAQLEQFLKHCNPQNNG